jgi:2-polyprenyl-6-methoxyphenol hydroxylase-like FAD-dependent oxidoreductase
MGTGAKPILIAGGGVGGLSAALALGRRGHRVRVFEQAREFGAIGYGIQLGPNAFHMFERLGVASAVKHAADFPQIISWFDAYSGQEVVHLDGGAAIEQRFGHPYIIIHRVDLHHVLLDACKAIDTIEFAPASAVTRFDDHGDRVIVHTADGRQEEGTLLIGADGLRSRVRAQLFGEREPRMIGWVAHRTTLPMDQVPAGVPRERVALWGGEGFHIVHYPLRHGELFNVVIVFRTNILERKVDTDTYRAELMRTYAKAHPVMQSLIAIADLDWRGAIADRHPIRHWHKGRAVILGDAAHPTLQSLAQGACMAVEDGVCLAELIDLCEGDYESAFRQFERERVLRTARVIYESRYMWTAFHAEGAAREPVHRRYRSMSREDVWNALAWLYNGYHVPTSLKTNRMAAH